MMFPTRVEAVIFDMDGLLLDTEVLYRDAIFAACADQSHDMTAALHLSLVGTPKELGDALLTTHFGTRFDLHAYHDTCSKEFDRRCATEVPLKKGAVDLLTYLGARGIPLGVATSTAGPIARSRLERANVLHFFDVVIGRTDVVKGKPHPESYLTAARQLRARPSACVALEDSHNGVRSASAAGMVTIMVPDLLEPTPEIRSLCGWVAPSLLDVLDALSAGS
jgi:HAD superfamily hydrolase (TIGR01509 family)